MWYSTTEQRIQERMIARSKSSSRAYRAYLRRRSGRSMRHLIGNLFDSGAGVRGLRSSGVWTGLGSLANRLPSPVAFWLANGLRPDLVHPVRLWLKRGLLCR